MEQSETDQGRLTKLGSEILRAAAVELAGKALVYVGIGFLAAFALLIWQGGSIPSWVLLLPIAAALVVAVAQARRVRSLGADNSALERELGRHNEYSRHLQNSLDALQRVISGDVDAEIPYYLEQAVLEPARRILSEKPAEKVRLSVLMPADKDSQRWSMRWAAGHSMIGQLKFDEPIGGTLARHAFESGEAQYWEDTERQTEFQQNPLASSPMRSLLSIPIREGDDVLGVFDAISSEKEAFDEAEQTFLASLAGVIAVAVSVWHQGEEPSPDSDRGQH